MGTLDYILVLLVALFLAASYLLGFTPILIAITCVLLSAITFLVYLKDKRAAERAKWRTPETTLHFLALIGGWPGAHIAQQMFRHKTKKVPFRVGFWVTVLANMALVAWLHTPFGSNALYAFVLQLRDIIEINFGESNMSHVLLYCLQYRTST